MSTTMDISNEKEVFSNNDKKNKLFFLSNVRHFFDKHREQHAKKVIHSIKVGTALVLVSLIYLLDPLFEHVGENAMWAIMTVVVVYDFYAGATLSKGLLRGIGTILGGGSGCLAAILSDDFGKTGNTIVVGTSVFIFGGLATYCRMIPSIKKKYDYGFMIFILTFSLVAVSGLRADKISELARERLTTIGMGYAVCLITNFLIFPMWAGQELHHLTSSRFNKLACCIEECMEAYFSVNEKEGQKNINISSCKSILHSKSSDDSLANFARWEPWHGNFGFYYPWEKYLQIGELLRELAAIILSLQASVQSPLQPSTRLQRVIEEKCNNIGVSLVLTMRELGESIEKMTSVQEKVVMLPGLQSIKLELTMLSTSELREIENVEAFTIANFLFLLMEISDKVKVIAKEVDELGDVAGFHSK